MLSRGYVFGMTGRRRAGCIAFGVLSLLMTPVIAVKPGQAVQAVVVGSFGLAVTAIALSRPPSRSPDGIRNERVLAGGRLQPATVFGYEPIGWGLVIGAAGMAVACVALGLAGAQSLADRMVEIAGVVLFGGGAVLLALQKGRSDLGLEFTPDGLQVRLPGGGQYYPWDALHAVELRDMSTRYARDNLVLAFDADYTRVRAAPLARLLAVFSRSSAGRPAMTVGLRRLRCDPRLVLELAQAMIDDPAARRRLGGDELLDALRRGNVTGSPSRLPT